MVRALHPANGDSPLQAEVQFTPASATEMLPLVRRIVADMLRLSVAIAAGRDQVEGIEQLADTIDRREYRDELADIRASLADDQVRFDGCMRELRALGIIPHTPFDGSLDFPAIEGRCRIYLCWRPGDERVTHWHEPGAAAADRQSLGTGPN